MYCLREQRGWDCLGCPFGVQVWCRSGVPSREVVRFFPGLWCWFYPMMAPYRWCRSGVPVAEVAVDLAMSYSIAMASSSSYQRCVFAKGVIFQMSMESLKGVNEFWF